jgi:hypothetical protein
MPVRLIVLPVILALWFASLPTLAFADTCQERAAAVRAGRIPIGQSDPDCDAGGRMGALLSWLAAGLAAAGAAAAAGLGGGAGSTTTEQPKKEPRAPSIGEGPKWLKCESLRARHDQLCSRLGEAVGDFRLARESFEEAESSLKAFLAYASQEYRKIVECRESWGVARNRRRAGLQLMGVGAAIAGGGLIPEALVGASALAQISFELNKALAVVLAGWATGAWDITREKQMNAVLAAIAATEASFNRSWAETRDQLVTICQERRERMEEKKSVLHRLEEDVGQAAYDLRINDCEWTPCPHTGVVMR